MGVLWVGHWNRVTWWIKQITMGVDVLYHTTAIVPTLIYDASDCAFPEFLVFMDITSIIPEFCAHAKNPFDVYVFTKLSCTCKKLLYVYLLPSHGLWSSPSLSDLVHDIMYWHCIGLLKTYLRHNILLILNNYIQQIRPSGDILCTVNGGWLESLYQCKYFFGFISKCPYGYFWGTVIILLEWWSKYYPHCYGI